MRDVFPGYYRPTQDELSDLWNTALIVLDTNALFNLFRYSNGTRQAFLSVLESKKERLWIPHQVGLEFQRGRLTIIKDQSKAFTDLIGKSEKALATVTSDIGALRNHPTLDFDELRATVEDAVKRIKETIESTRDRYQAEVLDALRHDETTDKITELYTGRVGQPYEEKQLEDIYSEGEERYAAKRPPGYKDANKPSPDRYGDLVLWCQVLDKAEQDQSAVIFVSEDQKEDWWRDFDGRKIGPRVELVDEFMARTGKRAYFLTPPGLVELANEYGATITEDTVREITQVSAGLAHIRQQSVVHSNQEPELRLHTHELADQIYILRRNRDEIRSRLSDLLEQRDLLDFDGPEGPRLFEGLKAEMSHLHHESAALSQRIRQLERERSKRREKLSDEDKFIRYELERIEIARYLLNLAGIKIGDDDVDWFKVPDARIMRIIERLDSGQASRKFALALRDLPTAPRQPEPITEHSDNTPLNRSRSRGDGNLNRARVDSNRMRNRDESLRAKEAQRHRLLDPSAEGDE